MSNWGHQTIRKACVFIFFVLSYSYLFNLILGLRSGLGASIFAIVIQKKKRGKKENLLVLMTAFTHVAWFILSWHVKGYCYPLSSSMADVSLILTAMEFSAQGNNLYHFRRLLLEIKKENFFWLTWMAPLIWESWWDIFYNYFFFTISYIFSVDCEEISTNSS